ncbi:putative DNA polymerase X family [Klebsormidium nitens]|uniref:DNA polymerase n=1 Tax=Klebsormidium nitens TaxID=105231 RepID=A0A1Y1IN70_KLENI|nr:putative DNA polymerase X family [Klebsormidium nitens]|eukprot:GAQ91562.1 putative DNA polymerase X family [Klebsormidium nitens]
MKRSPGPGRPARASCKRTASDPLVVQKDGIFRDVHMVLIPGGGILEKQLQIWCRKVTALGGSCRTLSSGPTTADVIDVATHIAAATTARLEQRMEKVELVGRAARAVAVSFKWLEECLASAAQVPVDNFLLREVGWYEHDKEGPTGSEQPGTAGGACPAPLMEHVTAKAASPGYEPLPLPTSGLSLPLNNSLSLDDSTNCPALSHPSPSNDRVQREGTACGVRAGSDGSDDEAGPCVRDALQARGARGGSREERLQEWMRTEVALRRQGRPREEGAETQDGCEASQYPEVDDESTLEGAEGDIPLDLNEHITRHLRELKDIYEALGDEWRALTYRRAVGVLERLSFRIASAEQLAGVMGVGQQVRDKVKEILGTGRLAKLDSLQSDAKLRVLRLFSSVFGVGAKTALELYSRGHRSLADLRGDPSLSRQAQLGLRYYEEIGAKMSRDDVARIHALVQAQAESICPGVSCEVTGSYRRGRIMCGDVDFLVTHPDGKSHRGLLARLHQRLTAIGFLMADLRSFDDDDQGGGALCQTYLGMCRLPGTDDHRRIDIKVYSAAVYACALVHFTGNEVFNRKVRFFALQTGFKLSEYGLFPVTKIGKRKFVDKTSLPCATERDVFAHLGLEYLEPHERNW